MRSLIQSIWTPALLAFALCAASVVGCLGEAPLTSVNPLQSAGGNAGDNPGSGGGAGSSGAAGSVGQGGSSGSSSISGSGGSPGGAGSGGAAPSAGTGGADDAADAGDVRSEPDAAQPEDPPDEEEPVDEAVTFSDVFPLLVTECGNCHGANAPGGRPRFAIGNNEAASYAATQQTAQQQRVAARIVTRAVIQRTMPTGCNGGALGTGTCLTEEQAELLQQWEDQGALP